MTIIIKCLIFYETAIDVSRCRRQMPISRSAQLTVEKTPSYFVTTDVAERIYHMSPNTKIIIVVRDPVTRAISDYAQSRSKRRRLLAFERLAFKNTTVATNSSTVTASSSSLHFFANDSSVFEDTGLQVNAKWGAIRRGWC